MTVSNRQPLWGSVPPETRQRAPRPAHASSGAGAEPDIPDGQDTGAEPSHEPATDAEAGFTRASERLVTGPAQALRNDAPRDTPTDGEPTSTSAAQPAVAADDAVDLALPALSPEEYVAIKADIAEHGVLVPIVVDEQGRVIDGRIRQAIAEELHLDYQSTTLEGLDDEAKVDRGIALNLKRRHLSRAERVGYLRRLAALRGVRLGRPGRQKAATMAGLAKEFGLSPRALRRDLQQDRDGDLAARPHAGRTSARARKSAKASAQDAAAQGVEPGGRDEEGVAPSRPSRLADGPAEPEALTMPEAEVVPLTEAWLLDAPPPTADPEAPATLEVHLDPAEWDHICVVINPAGTNVQARDLSGHGLARSVSVSLEPAGARAVGVLLSAVADAADGVAGTDVGVSGG
jgi:hypothetical protein